jgi:hypothetical protein
MSAWAEKKMCQPPYFCEKSSERIEVKERHCKERQGAQKTMITIEDNAPLAANLGFGRT